MFDRKKYMKEYQKNNAEHLRRYKELWLKNNPEYMKQYGKQWIKDNREKRKEYKGQWQINNRKKLKEYNQQYGEDHKGQRNQRIRNRRRTDIRFHLNCRIVCAINLSLKGNKNGRHWETLVGYTLNALIKRLKKTMPKGYTWQDYLDGKLHLDHRIPISVHNFDSPNQIDFKRCWALKNLQFLPAKENIAKSNKLTRPFQPALKLNFEG
jgi:hypothetical protein